MIFYNYPFQLSERKDILSEFSVNEIIKPLGMTPEWLVEQFIRFCADPKNTEVLRNMVDEWKSQDNTL